ncbi:uncharacterized protein FTJAE_1579 [Fusarium tjaetaba]|uniref:Uncharacterized protein n=1 Tax=Fusarium tjaetaba TaxID=1567544 RepID=A0A8H5W6Y1_9HYPO|nr:uncharacterized protein FTJAE_1579 [Fusarium tjaetaba]KAF5647523.1 hypothetical protein FTJAE_1579 [Fusarium tjaetaba]
MTSLEDMLQAPDATVRAILRALCQDIDTRSRARSYFETLEAVNDSSDTRKRKAEDELSICVQCDEAFYTNDNNDKDACCYHWGELEPDYDADIWADHDENCHGTIDTESMRVEYPEGFVWNCCDKPGDEDGCYHGRHEADPTKSRRASGEEPSDLEDYDDDDDV